MNKEATIKALKELGRVLLFAAISFGISYLGKLPQSETVMYGTLVLKIVDKYVHENEDISLKGISPF